MGLGPQLPGRWLGVAERQGNLMCYNVLNNKGNEVFRYIVQRVNQLELQTTEYIELFKEFDATIK